MPPLPPRASLGEGDVFLTPEPRAGARPRPLLGRRAFGGQVAVQPRAAERRPRNLEPEPGYFPARPGLSGVRLRRNTGRGMSALRSIWEPRPPLGCLRLAMRGGSGQRLRRDLLYLGRSLAFPRARLSFTSSFKF